jgi:hypothetical protein
LAFPSQLAFLSQVITPSLSLMRLSTTAKSQNPRFNLSLNTSTNLPIPQLHHPFSPALMTLSQSNTPSTNESRTDFSTLPGACTSTMLFLLIYIIVINPNNIIKHRLKPEPKIMWDDININLVVVVRLWINRSFNFNKLNWLKASSSYVNLELPRIFRFSPKKWSDCLTLMVL